ncbi:MAG: hypothetical protein A2061_11210 [Gallionellales bacterium GWA2_59_43]|nr:MAG: hypothetical protein A2061_11210 [Gallionellales bacterium GWA2_59_43]
MLKIDQVIRDQLTTKHRCIRGGLTTLRSRAPVQARAADHSLLIALGLLGSGVRHFFLVRFPGGFIANKKLPRYNFFLTGSYVECVTIWNLGAGKKLLIITHDSISFGCRKRVVENGRNINRLVRPLSIFW